MCVFVVFCFLMLVFWCIGFCAWCFVLCCPLLVPDSLLFAFLAVCGLMVFVLVLPAWCLWLFVSGFMSCAVCCMLSTFYFSLVLHSSLFVVYGGPFGACCSLAGVYCLLLVVFIVC